MTGETVKWKNHLFSKNGSLSCSVAEVYVGTCTQNHRITGCSGLEGTSVGHLVQPSCWSRVTQSRLHSTASRRVWNISREGDSTTSPWAARARAPSPSEGRSSSSCSAGTSSASFCARCPLSCRWAPLERVWPRPPDPHPADIDRHF